VLSVKLYFETKAWTKVYGPKTTASVLVKALREVIMDAGQIGASTAQHKARTIVRVWMDFEKATSGQSPTSSPWTPALRMATAGQYLDDIISELTIGGWNAWMRLGFMITASAFGKLRSAWLIRPGPGPNQTSMIYDGEDLFVASSLQDVNALATFGPASGGAVDDTTAPNPRWIFITWDDDTRHVLEFEPERNAKHAADLPEELTRVFAPLASVGIARSNLFYGVDVVQWVEQVRAAVVRNPSVASADTYFRFLAQQQPGSQPHGYTARVDFLTVWGDQWPAGSTPPDAAAVGTIRYAIVSKYPPEFAPALAYDGADFYVAPDDQIIDVIRDESQAELLPVDAVAAAGADWSQLSGKDRRAIGHARGMDVARIVAAGKSPLATGREIAVVLGWPPSQAKRVVQPFYNTEEGKPAGIVVQPTDRTLMAAWLPPKGESTREGWYARTFEALAAVGGLNTASNIFGPAFSDFVIFDNAPDVRQFGTGAVMFHRDPGRPFAPQLAAYLKWKKLTDVVTVWLARWSSVFGYHYLRLGAKGVVLGKPSPGETGLG
jgi:hypothetical protein